MICPDTNVLLDFVEGRLAGVQRSSVQAHFDACLECRWAAVSIAPSALAQGAQEPAAPGRPPAGDEELEPGLRFGRYTVLEWLGEGAMGVVYGVYDAKLDRKVAFKLLHRNIAADPELQSRQLLREAQAMARISHPNVLAVYDVGHFHDQVFLAMEMVDGIPLSEWLQVKSPSWPEVQGVLLQAGRGLAAAHHAGVIHRDFKPDNVLIGLDGRVRVTDFGLARAIEPSGACSADAPGARSADAPGARSADAAPGARSADAPGARSADAAADATAAAAPAAGPTTAICSTWNRGRAGTPAFMSPEQITLAQVDARSDQFSFAVAAYEALYGEHPFAGKGTVELEHAILNGLVAPPPRSSKTPMQLRKPLLRALSVSPDDRFESMERLLKTLARDPHRVRRSVIRWSALVVMLFLAAFAFHTIESHRGGRCKSAGKRLDGVWDAKRQRAIRHALSSTGLSIVDVWPAVEGALGRYAGDWVSMATEACEATYVRGEQPMARLAERTQCLDSRLEEMQQLTDAFLRADGPVVIRAVERANSLTPVAYCGNQSVINGQKQRWQQEKYRHGVATRVGVSNNTFHEDGWFCGYDPLLKSDHRTNWIKEYEMLPGRDDDLLQVSGSNVYLVGHCYNGCDNGPAYSPAHCTFADSTKSKYFANDVWVDVCGGNPRSPVGIEPRPEIDGTAATYKVYRRVHFNQDRVYTVLGSHRDEWTLCN